MKKIIIDEEVRIGDVILEKGDVIKVSEKKPDIKNMIQSLRKDFSGDNEDQMRGVQLLKGLAVSDDPKANEFMKKLDKATTKISKELV